MNHSPLQAYALDLITTSNNEDEHNTNLTLELNNSLLLDCIVTPNEAILHFNPNMI